MPSLKTIKWIDQRNKDLMFGFIREINELYTTIPMMINYICLLYYYLIPEKFIKCSSNLNITSSDSNKNDVVTICKYSSEWENMHGNVIINTENNPNVIATWTVKTNSVCCIIGIHSMYDDENICYGDDYNDSESGSNRMSPNYGWEGEGGRIGTGYTWYGGGGMEKFDDGDNVIKMELNVSKKQLKFYKNGQETKVVFNDIDITTDYHLMIRCYPKQHQINVYSFQIMEFTITNNNSISFYSQ